MTFKEWECIAEYTPLNRFFSCGNEIQVCGLIFPNNIHVTERTFFPWNVFKNVTTYWVLDIVLPNKFKDKINEFGGELSDCYYTEEGYGMPEFKELEKAFDFNEWYHSEQM